MCVFRCTRRVRNSGVRLRVGVKVNEQLLRTLRSLANDASGARNSPGPENHRVLVLKIAHQLRMVVPPGELDRLAFTSSFWNIHGSGLFTTDFIDFDLEQIVNRLTDAADGLERELKRWEYAGHLIVPDTNVFIHHLTKNSIVGTDWRALAGANAGAPVTVVLAVTVLDELDNLKRQVERSQARQTVKEIGQLTGDGVRADLGHDTALEILVPEPDHVPLPIADNEIIDQAMQLATRAPLGSRVTIVTGDGGMAMRSRTMGQSAVFLEQIDP